MKIAEGRLRVSASDVANFLACRRLTQLDLLRARGELRPPHARDLGFEDLVRRGEEHERTVLERFRADGHDVADVSGAQDIRGGAGATARSPKTQGPPSEAGLGSSIRGHWPEKATG